MSREQLSLQWHKAATNPQDHGTRHLALTKTRPMTSQDLFKTGESFLYRPDETHKYRRQGRCSHQHPEIAELSLPLCSHRSPWSRRSCPSQLCLCFSMRSRAHCLPTTPQVWKWQTCSPPMQKSTQQSRDPLCWPAEGWNSSSSSSVVFVLMGTASNLTIAKVEQQRAGKRHQLPVHSPICALEHLPKTFLIIRVLLYQAQHCTGKVNDY